MKISSNRENSLLINGYIDIGSAEMNAAKRGCGTSHRETAAIGIL